jgi:hypothetical protein
MTTHKKSMAATFTLLTCALSSAGPDAFIETNMELYNSDIEFDVYVNRLVRLDIGCSVMNFLVFICVHLLLKAHKNFSVQYFIYVLLALQSLPNIEILLDHYNHNIANPSEMIVFHYLTDEFGWAAHLFYAVPLLSLILPIMIWLIYKGITKSS